MIPNKEITKIIEDVKIELGGDIEYLTEWICESFAEAVVNRIPDSKMWWDCDIDPKQSHIHPNERHPSHCFIEYNGKFYDAACPNGVNDWRDLPFFCARQYLLK